MSDSSPNSVDAFLAAARLAETTITGYIARDPGDGSVILFGPNSYKCPHLAIPRDEILDIRQGQIHRCSGGGRVLFMWYATLVLKPAETTEGQWLQRLLIETLAEPLKSDCSCIGGVKASCNDKYWEDASTSTKVHLDRARNDITGECYRKDAEVHLGRSVAERITQGVSEATRAIGGALSACGCGVAGVWVTVAGELVRIGYDALKNSDGSIDLKIDYVQIRAGREMFPLLIDAATAGKILDSF